MPLGAAVDRTWEMEGNIRESRFRSPDELGDSRMSEIGDVGVPHPWLTAAAGNDYLDFPHAVGIQ